MSGYEITEKDIDGMLNYLRAFHPENANREFAKEMLEYMKATYRRLASTDSEALDELYESFKQSGNS
ncbi:MAG TPA: hypothetical protein VMR08_04405 [Patescibacteria group bacterium]|nr:hypothetical protein [Patescibacteria group bacterium]